MSDINEVFSEYHGTLSSDDKALLQKAFDTAYRAHQGQQRASGEPYFNHVFATAKNLASFGMDVETIAAGFLHDTIEDTDVTEDEIQKEFGDEIVRMVNGVTKLGKIKYQGRERHVESLRKFFIAVSKDLRIVVIKLADRLHNINTLKHIKPEKAKRIALETIEIYGPLAYRLGMGRLVGQLQDGAFPFAFPKESEEVNDLLKEKKNLNEDYLLKVSKTLKRELAEAGIRNFRMDERVKGKYSLWHKLKRKNMDIEEIYDIVALRVVTDDIADCYRILGIIHSKWKPLPGRIKDYIALPKVNGYQSLHTTIFTGDGGIAEIQIRTEAMHNFAEYGFAAHYMYKNSHKEEGASSSVALPSWLTQLKDLQENEENQNKFLKNLREDFFEDRIFVFTPMGDVIDLPKDSSAIDLAYAVHSEIGDTAQAAIINGKHSALKTQLNSGDIVEIQTNKKGTPSSKWIPYVKTTLARRHIEKHVRENSIWEKVKNFNK